MTQLIIGIATVNALSGHLQELPLEASSQAAEQVDDFQVHGATPEKDATVDEMARLQEISTLLIREGNVAALYERVLDGAIRLMSADMGSMQMFDRERGELKLIASRGFHPESVAPLVSRSGALLGMISTHWREPYRPTERSLCQLDVLARQAADLIERSQAEAELRQSEERCRRLAEIVESSDDAIISTDLSAIISTWNKGAERLYGYTAEEIIGRPISTLIPPDRHQEELAILTQIRRGERVGARDTVRRRKDGSLVDVLLTVSSVKNAAGAVVGASSIVRDITDRKRLETDVQLLLRELDHRARNLLALVQATVILSNADTAQDLKAMIGGRIRALSQAHTLLAQTRWKGAYLASLVKQELAPYCSEQALRANVNGADIQLAPSQAQSLALLFHELTTNAVKYGALSVPTGRVRVVWTKKDDGLLFLRWIEQDGPSINPPERRGFGMRVVEEVVRGQLGGQVQFDWAPGGLTCSVKLQSLPDAQEVG